MKTDLDTEEKILKLFFLLDRIIEFPDIFKKTEEGKVRLISDSKIDIFYGETSYAKQRFHIFYGTTTMIIIYGDKNNSDKFNSVTYDGVHHNFNMIYDNIYEAALKHNFLHEIGKFK